MTRLEPIAAPSAAQELNITRIFPAPRPLVFKVWTDSRHVAQWWGAAGYTNPVCELDVRPGGAIRIDMTSPDGVLIPVSGRYHEIVAPERLVFTTTAFVDEDGVPQLEGLHTVTFADHGGKTRLTLRCVVFRATPAMAVSLAGMEQGWDESLDRLEAELRQTQGALTMTDQTEQRDSQAVPRPNPDLKGLDRLVGTRKVTGGAEGTTRYEWMDGGFFMIQHYDPLAGRTSRKGH